jgi:AcrR family transcriptional regulator
MAPPESLRDGSRKTSSELARQRVCDAAFSYFTDRSTLSPTVRDLLRAASTNTRFVRHWWGGAEELIKAAVEEQFSNILTELRAFDSGRGDLKSRAAAFGNHVADLLHSERCRRFLFVVVRDATVRPWLRSLYQRLEHEISCLSRTVIAGPSARRVDVRESAVRRFMLRLASEIVLTPLLENDALPSHLQRRAVAQGATEQLLSGVYHVLEVV